MENQALPTVAELSAMLDKYLEVRARRRKMKADAEKLKDEEEKPLFSQIMTALKASGSSGIGGKTHKAILVPKTIPQVTDWTALYAHIKETGEFELLQRRLSPPAVKERWDDKLEVPGVSPIPVEDLSITKL